MRDHLSDHDRRGGMSVAVISSHVARGAVGNRAKVFALETLGWPVIAVPTVMLPWHPGHGASTRIVPDDDAMAAFLNDLATGPFRGEIGAVLTGYLGSPAQAAAIADAVTLLREANPALVFVCDPVIGDDKGLYVPEQTAIEIRDRLVPLADLATPNRFELAWLTGRSASDIAGLVSCARALGPPNVLVTSVFARPGGTGNLLVTEEGALLAEHAALDGEPKGTGDMTAALFLAHRLAGLDWRESLRLATASVHDLVVRGLARGADELALARDAAALTEPQSDLVIRTVDATGHSAGA